MCACETRRPWNMQLTELNKLISRANVKPTELSLLNFTKQVEWRNISQIDKYYIIFPMFIEPMYE